MKTKHNSIPFCWTVEGLQIVVVGGGKVATRKVAQLVGRGAVITVVAMDVCSELEAIGLEYGVHFIRRFVKESDLETANMVFLATDQPALHDCLQDYCKVRRIPVNRSDANTGDFSTMAVIEVGLIQVGISSGGASPSLVKQLKKDIHQLVSSDLSEMADLLNELRQMVKQEVQDADQRSILLKKAALLNREDLMRILNHEEDYRRFKRESLSSGSDTLGD